MEAFTTLVTQASDYLWNWVLLILLVGTGLYFTLRLRFVQVRRFGEGMRRLFGGFSLHGKAAGKDGMSSFQGADERLSRPRSAPATSRAARPRWSAAGRGRCSGCGYRRFWAWRRSTPRPCWRRNTRPTVDGHVTGGPIYYIRAAFRGRFGPLSGGLLLAGNHPGAWLYGQYGPVQFHRRCVPQRVRHQQTGGRRHHCRSGCVHLFGRCNTHCLGDRKARPGDGRILYRRLCRDFGDERCGACPMRSHRSLCSRSARRQWPAAWPV